MELETQLGDIEGFGVFLKSFWQNPIQECGPAYIGSSGDTLFKIIDTGTKEERG